MRWRLIWLISGNVCPWSDLNIFLIERPTNVTTAITKSRRHVTFRGKSSLSSVDFLRENNNGVANVNNIEIIQECIENVHYLARISVCPPEISNFGTLFDSRIKILDIFVILKSNNFDFFVILMYAKIFYLNQEP